MDRGRRARSAGSTIKQAIGAGIASVPIRRTGTHVVDDALMKLDTVGGKTTVMAADVFIAPLASRRARPDAPVVLIRVIGAGDRRSQR